MRQPVDGPHQRGRPAERPVVQPGDVGAGESRCRPRSEDPGGARGERSGRLLRPGTGRKDRARPGLRGSPAGPAPGAARPGDFGETFMQSRVQDIRRQFDHDLARVQDADSLEEVRTRYLGRRAGLVTALLRELRAAPPEKRAAFGKAVNELQTHVEAALEGARTTV